MSLLPSACSRVAAAAPTALLVDGENMSCEVFAQIQTHIGQFTDLRVRRVFGNVMRLGGWTEVPGFLTVHTPTAKNSADMALALDALTLVIEDGIARIVLVASDSDFTLLAHRLRERGAEVLGLGDARAPQGFRAACSRFEEICTSPARKSPAPTPVAPAPAPFPKDKTLVGWVRAELVKAGGGMPIQSLGAQMGKTHNVRIGQGPHRQWRRFLTAHPGDFLCDQKGPDAAVRLVVNPT